MIICNLGVLMAERKLSIQDIADNTKLSRTTISALLNENGKGIQFDTMEALCRYLKVTPGDLFSYIDLEVEFQIDLVYLGTQNSNYPWATIEKKFECFVSPSIKYGDILFDEKFTITIDLAFESEDGNVIKSSFLENESQLFSKFMRKISSRPHTIITERLKDKIYTEFTKKYKIHLSKHHIKHVASIFL